MKHIGTLVFIFSQAVIFTAWIVKIDARVKFLQKRNTELTSKVDNNRLELVAQISEVNDSFNNDIKSIESKLDEIFRELAEVSKQLAVIIDRQERNHG